MRVRGQQSKHKQHFDRYLQLEVCGLLCGQLQWGNFRYVELTMAAVSPRASQRSPRMGQLSPDGLRWSELPMTLPPL